MSADLYRCLGNTGLKVSNICLGAMTFGAHEFFPETFALTENDCFGILDRFIELGGNFIDTADIYHLGESEKIIGKWLKKTGIALSLVQRLAFKSTQLIDTIGLSRKHIMWSVEQSLHRLQTDYIDLYQVHVYDYATPVEETFRTLDTLVKLGKIRYVGVSNFCGYQLQKAVDVCKSLKLENIVTLQQQYNLLCRHPELEEFNVCEENRIGVLPWSPLIGGLLSGKYGRNMVISDLDETSRVGFATKTKKFINEAAPDFEKMDESQWDVIENLQNISKELGKSPAQVAIRWLLQKPVVTSVVVGVKTIKQLEENMAAATGWKLTSQQMAHLDDVSSIKNLHYPYALLLRSRSQRIDGTVSLSQPNAAILSSSTSSRH